MNRIVQVEGKEIQISNPDKKLFPGITKWDWILHLSRLAPRFFSYARGRYLTTIRYPDGVEGKFFYQKNVPDHAPRWIQIRSLRGGESYPFAGCPDSDLAGKPGLSGISCFLRSGGPTGLFERSWAFGPGSVSGGL